MSEEKIDTSSSKEEESNVILTPLSDGDRQILLNLYNEICKSYHVIDDFRTKLLGFLPVLSVVGVLFIEFKGEDSTSGEDPTQLLIPFLGIFAAFLTLSLFTYEIRSIIRSNNLIYRGAEIEKTLLKHLGSLNITGIKGQFYVCKQEAGKEGTDILGLPKNEVNSIFAACMMYSSVFAAWLFVFLKYVDLPEQLEIAKFLKLTTNCVYSSVAIGLGIWVVSFVLLRRFVAS